jgi:hypothetical protein
MKLTGILTGLSIAAAGLFLSLAPGAGGSAGDEPGLTTLEKQFRELPPEARKHTGPLFWLHGDDSRERLEMYVGKVAEGGNGCFTAESRPHNDWLGEGWWRDLGICLEAAKKNGLTMWIFDEKWWPSGEVGGKVPPEYGEKRLAASAATARGNARFTDTGYGGANFVAALAGKRAGRCIDGSSLVDLSAWITGGRLDWKAPPGGSWQVMKFTWHHNAKGRILVDGASKDCVDWYIRTVYQPHYDHFREDFGHTIAGYFYDEPETHGDWGTEVLGVLNERGVDWKKALVAWKFTLAGEEQTASRYQYRDAFAEAWGRTLYGGLTRWCTDHGVKSMGHFLEHAYLYLDTEFCAGNMMQLQKYSAMGAIDAVFTQFKPGVREAYDPPCWQIPKLGSSVTHAYGKPDDVTMVEIFGARGQDLPYPEMKWWADHMQVSGVNFLIPHSFNPRSPYDNDCPPYFYDGGFEPRWPLYRVFADYTSRLSLMLTGGRHVCPVALLYLGNSSHVGKFIPPDQMSESLQDALYDSDWLPYEVFEKDAAIAGREITLRDESYKVLIVPQAEVIPYGTLLKVRQFFEAGGVVVGYGILPGRSATLGHGSADIAQLREAIWGRAKPSIVTAKTSSAGGRSFFLPSKPAPEELQQVLAGVAGVRADCEVSEGRTDHWLHVLHRVKSGRDIFLVCNQNYTGEVRRFRFRFNAAGEPECWDPMRGEITSVNASRSGGLTEITLAMEPSESVLLVFSGEKRALPMRPDQTASGGGTMLPVVRDATPDVPAPVLENPRGPSVALRTCRWIWYPEGDPMKSAPPGARYFRKQLALPASAAVKKAVFTGTADNNFVLYVNGNEAGASDKSDEGWRSAVELDVSTLVHGGVNQLAVKATNNGQKPNPAGLIGLLTVEFAGGDTLVARLDGSWRTSRESVPGWTREDFPEGAWKRARELAPFGGGPWGTLNVMLTVGPVKADPFWGHADVPPGVDIAKTRVVLEADDIAPEAAARVTVNGSYAGGFIGKPFHLDVTKYVKTGANSIRIEPFAPRKAMLVLYE